MKITFDTSKIPECDKQVISEPIQPKTRIDSSSNLWWVYFDKTGKLIAAEPISKKGDNNDKTDIV